MKRFQGGLVFKAHRPLYHSVLGSRVIKKKKKYRGASAGPAHRHSLPVWREAGPANHHDDKVDSVEQVVNKELSLLGGRPARIVARRSKSRIPFPSFSSSSLLLPSLELSDTKDYEP